MKKSILTASVIVGGCLIIAAGVISGAINLKDEHVIQTTQGNVKLGDVYLEDRYLSIELSGTDGDKIVSINNINPEDYKSVIGEKLQELNNSINRGVPENKRRSKSELTLSVPGEIKLTSSMHYRSKNIPDYTLTLDEKKIEVNKDEYVYGSLIHTAETFINEQQKNYADASQIK